jgi:hypothetical protein
MSCLANSASKLSTLLLQHIAVHCSLPDGSLANLKHRAWTMPLTPSQNGKTWKSMQHTSIRTHALLGRFHPVFYFLDVLSSTEVLEGSLLYRGNRHGWIFRYIDGNAFFLKRSVETSVFGDGQGAEGITLSASTWPPAECLQRPARLPLSRPLAAPLSRILAHAAYRAALARGSWDVLPGAPPPPASAADAVAGDAGKRPGEGGAGTGADAGGARAVGQGLGEVPRRLLELALGAYPCDTLWCRDEQVGS